VTVRDTVSIKARLIKAEDYSQREVIEGRTVMKGIRGDLGARRLMVR
jgi:hypothetical protein